MTNSTDPAGVAQRPVIAPDAAEWTTATAECPGGALYADVIYRWQDTFTASDLTAPAGSITAVAIDNQLDIPVRIVDASTACVVDRYFELPAHTMSSLRGLTGEVLVVEAGAAGTVGEFTYQPGNAIFDPWFIFGPGTITIAPNNLRFD